MAIVKIEDEGAHVEEPEDRKRTISLTVVIVLILALITYLYYTRGI